MIEFVAGIARMREELQRAAKAGYAAAVAGTLRKRDFIDPAIAIPPGMLDALVAAALARPEALPALQAHYCVAMPSMLADQLRRAGGPEEKLLGARIDLRRMPRLRAGLESLFARVASASPQCEAVLGAATPAALAGGRTWGEMYTKCHFGRFDADALRVSGRSRLRSRSARLHRGALRGPARA